MLKPPGDARLLQNVIIVVVREIPFAGGCKVKLLHLLHYVPSFLEAHHLWQRKNIRLSFIHIS